MKYKIIQEYERFYVCEYESKLGKIRESFIKDENIKVEDGYVYTKPSVEQIHEGLPSEKVNKLFNPNNFGRGL